MLHKTYSADKMLLSTSSSRRLGIKGTVLCERRGEDEGETEIQIMGTGGGGCFEENQKIKEIGNVPRDQTKRLKSTFNYEKE
jgi:hypothetical protein